MKPQETKFTFVYNEIKQCRMHFTGISDTSWKFLALFKDVVRAIPCKQIYG